MKLDNKYRYTSKTTEESGENYGRFLVRGEFDFYGLEEIKELKMKRAHPYFKDENANTFVYSSPQAVLVIFSDNKTKEHEINISIKNSPKNKQSIEFLKSSLEDKLKTDLEEY